MSCTFFLSFQTVGAPLPDVIHPTDAYFPFLDYDVIHRMQDILRNRPWYV